MTPHSTDLVVRALSRLPTVCCILSAAFDRARAGVMVRWAVQCAEVPPLVCAVVRKGHPVEPLIRDSHGFALNLVEPGERLLLRAFGGDGPPPGRRGHTDPFDALDVKTLVSGSPVLVRALAAMDCDLVSHVDLEEAGHELYVGRIVAAHMP